MPPQVKKTAPNGPLPKPAKRGILSRAVSVDRLTRSPVRVTIYGQNRVGKTTLGCQFPKPLLLVSFEPSESGGAESVRKVQGVEYLRLTSTEDALTLARELREDTQGFNSVLLDGATSLQDLSLQELMGLEELPPQMSYGLVSGDQYRARSEKTREVLRPFLAIPCDVIVLAKEKDHNPPKEEKFTASGKQIPDMRPKFLRGLQTESFISADLGGATAGWLADACDCICRLYMDEEVNEVKTNVQGQEIVTYEATGKHVRYLRTSYHPNFAAGVRSCTPEKVPEVIVAPTYQKLIKVLRGEG